MKVGLAVCLHEIVREDGKSMFSEMLTYLKAEALRNLL